MNPTPSRMPYAVIAAVVVVLDQATKFLVHSGMGLHDSRTLLEGVLSLTYVQNRGAAFGFLSDADLPYQAVLFTLISLVALGALAAYSFTLPAENRMAQTALALVMGGALGNLLNRAVLGYVIDFVDVFWGSHHWPAFNVADSAISIGVCLLILDILRTPAGSGSEAPKAGAMGEPSAAGRMD